MNKPKLFLILGLVLLATGIEASEAKKAIEERITPVGQVCVEGQECAETSSVAESILSGSRTGEEIYNSGDKVSWGERANEDLGRLVETVTNGLNGMPQMGLCMDCSQEELASSVQYMLDALN